MSKVRILGPRSRHAEVLRALQDFGIVHLASPTPDERFLPRRPTTAEEREARHLRHILEDIEAVLAAVARTGERPPAARVRPAPRQLALWARLARRTRRALDRLRSRGAELEEERALVLKYRAFFSAFESLILSQSRWPNATAYHVILRRREEETVPRLRKALAAIAGDEFEMRARPLPSGEIALLVLVPASVAGRIERALAEARVQEIPVPSAYGGRTLAEAFPRMMERLREIPREIEKVRREENLLAAAHGAELRMARAALHDRLEEIEAMPLARLTAHAFVVEGWMPARGVPLLRRRLQEVFGDPVVIVEVSSEEWQAEEAPVVLANPRLFRPFEVLIRPLPLPRYGSIDPTPFVAVFFPMFFGLILGDVGYGLLLLILGLILRVRSRPGTTPRSVSEVAGACAIFSILFGVLYGELMGDFGRRVFGMRPLLMNREEAVLPFLGLAVALGLVHVVLGLGLGVAANLRRHPRLAAGRGLAAVMVLLVAAMLLAACDLLPRAFFTPSVVTLLVAFPVLAALEGLLAPVEFLSYLGNILSYTRIMALGTASVMLAVVANRMTGAMGSVTVGVLFALLFHLVNFALGLFSPAIHSLRLHYVEFFGKFYSPGGVRYRPFGRWTPSPGHRA